MGDGPGQEASSQVSDVGSRDEFLSPYSHGGRDCAPQSGCDEGACDEGESRSQSEYRGASWTREPVTRESWEQGHTPTLSDRTHAHSHSHTQSHSHSYDTSWKTAEDECDSIPLMTSPATPAAPWQTEEPDLEKKEDSGVYQKLLFMQPAKDKQCGLADSGVEAPGPQGPPGGGKGLATSCTPGAGMLVAFLIFALVPLADVILYLGPLYPDATSDSALRLGSVPLVFGVLSAANGSATVGNARSSGQPVRAQSGRGEKTHSVGPQRPDAAQMPGAETASLSLANGKAPRGSVASQAEAQPTLSKPVPGKSTLAASAKLPSPHPKAMPSAKAKAPAQVVSKKVPSKTPRQAPPTATEVARSLRDMLQMGPLRPLSAKARDALGAPCSTPWKNSVLQYFKARPDLHRDYRTVEKAGLWEVCQRMEAALASLVQAGNCTGAGSDGASEKLPGPATALNSAAAATAGSTSPVPGVPAACDWDAGLTVGAPEAPLNWGSCWPQGLPMSPGLTLEKILKAKFLVAAYSKEQLSKAKIHLAEAARLARLTGRILVIPPASNSRIILGHPEGTPPAGPGRNFIPTCRYLDLDQAASRKLTVRVPGPKGTIEEMTIDGGADWISSDLFLLLLGTFLPRRPGVQFMCMVTPELYPCLGTAEVAGVMEHILVASYGVPPSKNNTSSFDMPWQPQLAASQVVARMRQTMGKADIVVLLKVTPCLLDFGFPNQEMFGDTLLPYAKPLRSRAAWLGRKISLPYISVHLRNEFIVWQLLQLRRADDIPEQMRKCAQSAVALIRREAAKVNTSKVFISADVPFVPYQGRNATSSSISSLDTRRGGPAALPSNSTRPAKATVAAAGPVEPRARSSSWGWFVSTLGRERTTDPAHEALALIRSSVPGTVMLDDLEPSVNRLDPGETSVLDKLVAALATEFLSASWQCGGGHSFESDIRRHRSIFGRNTDDLRWSSPL